MEMLPLMLLFLLCFVPQLRACLQCDRTVRLMLEDYILSEPNVLKQIELQKITDQGLVGFRETSDQYKGVIDFTTLYRAKTEFLSEFDRFRKTTTGSTSEAIQIMEKGREILEKYLILFIPDGLCPNKCGLLVRRVMDCTSCLYKTYICPSPTGQQDCGEFPVNAEEGDQAVLDCFLPWHRLLLGKPEYHYSWAAGVPKIKKLEESDFRVLVVTDEASVVLNQLHVEEEGTYRCLLQNQTGTVFYKVTFLISVRALPTQTQKPVITFPPLHLDNTPLTMQSYDALLVPLISTVIAACLAASLGLAILLRVIRKDQKRKGKEEEDLMQSLL